MTAATSFSYPGEELEIFAGASNWKSYWASKLRSSIRGEVIEVGAGLGGSTKFLVNDDCSKWICLDPDPGMVRQLEARIASGDLPARCEARVGILSDLSAETQADTIVYIDVLEHIEDDEAELRRAAERLRPGGRIIVLSPAHRWLWSPFDKAVGHFRRYSRREAARLTLPGLQLEKAFYLDSAGMAASLANRLLLRASAPSVAQVAFWDRYLVPLSRYTDKIMGATAGKTIVFVWSKVA